MKFSVLIPVYNVEKYICECIDSVMCQTYQDFEVILVDDGSTDSSGRICDECVEQNPEKIRVIHQRNQGQLAARCNGIRAANGEYCVFLDADDLLVENALNELNCQIIVHKTPDMVIFPFYYERDGKLLPSKLLNKSECLYSGASLQRLYEAFFSGTLLNTVWTKAVRREIALSSTEGYERFTSLRCSEDRYQSMMMLKTTQSVLYLPMPLYRYRLFSGSVTRHFLCRNIPKFNTAILYQEEKKCLIEWGMNTEEWRAKLDAQWLAYPLYVLDLFYNNVSRKERKEVLKYPWIIFLPEEISRQCIMKNMSLGEVQKKLWGWIQNRNEIALRLHFFKKNTYKKIRGLKQKMLH